MAGAGSRGGSGSGDRLGARRALRESPVAYRLEQRLGRLRARRGTTRWRVPFSGNGYQYEAEAVATAVRAGRTESPVMTLAESCEVMAVVDEARRGWCS
jgi:hypothetical protein